MGSQAELPCQQPSMTGRIVAAAWHNRMSSERSRVNLRPQTRLDGTVGTDSRPAHAIDFSNKFNRPWRRRVSRVRRVGGPSHSRQSASVIEGEICRGPNVPVVVLGVSIQDQAHATVEDKPARISLCRGW